MITWNSEALCFANSRILVLYCWILAKKEGNSGTWLRVSVWGLGDSDNLAGTAEDTGWDVLQRVGRIIEKPFFFPTTNPNQALSAEGFHLRYPPLGPHRNRTVHVLMGRQTGPVLHTYKKKNKTEIGAAQGFAGLLIQNQTTAAECGQISATFFYFIIFSFSSCNTTVLLLCFQRK